MQNESYSQLIQVLLKSGKISEEQVLTISLEKNTTKLSEAIIIANMGILKPEEIKELLENHFKTPFIDLDKIIPDKELLKIIPEELMRKFCFVPIEKKGNELFIAMSCPNNIVALDDIQIISGFSIKPQVALQNSIEKFIENFYSEDEMSKIENSSNIYTQHAEMDDENNESTVKLVNHILHDAVRLKASDIHIEPQEKGMFVRFRINGILHTKEFIPAALQPAITSRIKVSAGMDITEKRLPQDGQTNIIFNKREIDFRISTLPAKYGEKIVIRILDKSNFGIGIEQIGFLPDTQTKYEELLKAGSGIILVTGPTGSGKTSTLYSSLNRLKSSTKNIITLEDPIEYDLLSGKTRESGITQVQVNSKIGFTFAKALRSVLRQDPNIILVGEIRDEETCRIAINASLMGHLVLSTLHTNDSVSTVTRLLDMGIEPYLLSSSLLGIVAQRLVRVLCQHCREPYHPPKKILENLKVKIQSDGSGTLTFYRAKGCEYCDNSGYQGRMGVFELLLVNDLIKDLILKKARLSDISEAALQNGMITMKQNGIQLVAQGITTIAEVLRVLP